MKKILRIVIILIVIAAIITGGVLLLINNYSNSNYIGKDAASNIAISDLDINQDSASIHDCDLERKDGIVYYDIEIISGAEKHTYKISATTGEILAKHSKNVFD